MIKLLAVLLTLSAIFSFFMFLIEAFADHGLSSGQHGPEPLGVRILSASFVGTMTAILSYGAYKAIRASSPPERSRRGFPVLDRKDSQQQPIKRNQHV
jgi:hypothetical protein